MIVNSKIKDTDSPLIKCRINFVCSLCQCRFFPILKSQEKCLLERNLAATKTLSFEAKNKLLLLNFIRQLEYLYNLDDCLLFCWPSVILCCKLQLCPYVILYEIHFSAGLFLSYLNGLLHSEFSLVLWMLLHSFVFLHFRSCSSSFIHRLCVCECVFTSYDAEDFWQFSIIFWYY